ncbi:hypothetical protein [Streptomyces uncialis]|uniref:hypothetical protein n=1 Tax=Streptomyces uncialis TaxID=1048205 RepID=UPI0033D3FC18
MAVRSPVALPVVLPGATEPRLGVEAELRRRGWETAEAPAAADLLVVCGSPSPEEDRRLDTLLRTMSRPAARVDVTRPADAARALDEGFAVLRAGAASRSASPEGHENAVGGEHEAHPGKGSASAGPGHGPHHEHEEPGHPGHDETGGHGHSGHEGHTMSTVAGLPMADRAADRDGLSLDRLNLPLGPVLPDWPAGLILRCALQGDIVQEVRVDRLPGPPDGTSFWNEPWSRAARGEPVERGVAARRRCAAHLDSLGRLLSLAGRSDTAGRLRRLRDDVLAGAPSGHCGEPLRALTERVERSRTLRWGLAGLGRLPAERARRRGVTGPALEADGDAHDRLLSWSREARRAVRDLDDRRPLPTGRLIGPRGTVGGTVPPSQALLDVLPELLTGTELGCARLVVASLDPDLDEPVAVPATEDAHA